MSSTDLRVVPATISWALGAITIWACGASLESSPGLYTRDQATRGAEVYASSCLSCHGAELEGGGLQTSSLVGEGFREAWGRPGRTLDDLYYVIRMTMPPGEAPSLTDGQRTDVLAYILERNGFPPGDVALAPDAAHLGAIRLAEWSPSGPSREPPPDFILGSAGLDPEAEGPTQRELTAAAENSRDWLFHTHDYTGRRFVDLDQINTGNVAQLRPVCIYQTGEISNGQSGPIVYDGVMYVTTRYSTMAIDAATCRPLWRHTWDVLDDAGWSTNRGVAIGDGRVVRATTDGYLVALDAAHGRLLWARHAAQSTEGETFTMAPMIFEDMILVGPAGSENAIQGWVGAFRLADGEPVWRFNIVPQPGEPGRETWAEVDDFPLGGGAVWTPFTLDVTDGLLFVGATNPAPDFPADVRGGDNLYTNALIVIDVRTGELVWYDQMVPADAHDWDLTQVSPLFTSSVDGTERRLIATAGKDGMLRVLDRDTRERLYETPVTTIENEEAPVTSRGTHACPGLLGGVMWNGPAFNPRTNLLYTPAVDWCGTFYVAEELRFVPGAVFLGGTYMEDQQRQGWITAVDASDGSVRWRYRSPLPMLSAVTTTSGGLVLTGELTGDFLALDAATGEELYRFNTGGPMGGGVVTYALDGRQYIAVMSGRPSGYWIGEHPGAPTILVFALP